MKYRYFLVGLILFLFYIVLPKYWDSYAPPVSPKQVTAPEQVDFIPQVEKAPEQLTPTNEEHHEPNQEMSHEEFVEREKKYATEKLKALTMGWCNASEAEVAKHFIDSYTGEASRARKEIARPNSLCLNTNNKDWECFTYQVYCPRNFQETNDVTLLQFWSGESVYRYERRIMDYKTYIDNPDSPAFPGQSYWASRANDIKILAERVRGERVEEQTWANFRDGLNE